MKEWPWRTTISRTGRTGDVTSGSPTPEVLPGSSTAGRFCSRHRVTDGEKILQHYRDIGVEHEEWDLTTLRERAPLYSTKSYFPPAPIEDSGHSFWQDSDSHISGAIFTPGSGLRQRPSLGDPERASGS